MPCLPPVGITLIGALSNVLLQKITTPPDGQFIGLNPTPPLWIFCWFHNTPLFILWPLRPSSL